MRSIDDIKPSGGEHMDDDFFSSLPAEGSGPRFSVGEVAILQPPHPSARSLWGVETTILAIFWSIGGHDAMGGLHTGWSYRTDIPPPPITDVPEHKRGEVFWCEYDLKKKYEGGDSFEEIVAEIIAKSRDNVGVK